MVDEAWTAFFTRIFVPCLNPSVSRIKIRELLHLQLQQEPGLTVPKPRLSSSSQSAIARYLELDKAGSSSLLVLNRGAAPPATLLPTSHVRVRVPVRYLRAASTASPPLQARLSIPTRYQPTCKIALHTAAAAQATDRPHVFSLPHVRSPPSIPMYRASAPMADGRSPFDLMLVAPVPSRKGPDEGLLEELSRSILHRGRIYSQLSRCSSFSSASSRRRCPCRSSLPSPLRLPLAAASLVLEFRRTVLPRTALTGVLLAPAPCARIPTLGLNPAPRVSRYPARLQDEL